MLCRGSTPAPTQLFIVYYHVVRQRVQIVKMVTGRRVAQLESRLVSLHSRRHRAAPTSPFRCPFQYPKLNFLQTMYSIHTTKLTVNAYY